MVAGVVVCSMRESLRAHVRIYKSKDGHRRTDTQREGPLRSRDTGSYNSYLPIQSQCHDRSLLRYDELRSDLPMRRFVCVPRRQSSATLRYITALGAHFIQGMFTASRVPSIVSGSSAISSVNDMTLL